MAGPELHGADRAARADRDAAHVDEHRVVTPRAALLFAPVSSVLLSCVSLCRLCTRATFLACVVIAPRPIRFDFRHRPWNRNAEVSADVYCTAETLALP